VNACVISDPAGQTAAYLPLTVSTKSEIMRLRGKVEHIEIINMSAERMSSYRYWGGADPAIISGEDRCRGFLVLLEHAESSIFLAYIKDCKPDDYKFVGAFSLNEFVSAITKAEIVEKHKAYIYVSFNFVDSGRATDGPFVFVIDITKYHKILATIKRLMARRILAGEKL